ncbi:18867_t:CDS:2, partial [Dentiscutata erythropus]
NIKNKLEVKEKNALILAGIYNKAKSLFDNIFCKTKKQLEQSLNDYENRARNNLYEVSLIQAIENDGVKY